MVTGEARRGEQGGTCTREGGGCQGSAKNTKKKTCTANEAEGAVNDARRHGAVGKSGSWRTIFYVRNFKRGKRSEVGTSKGGRDAGIHVCIFTK